MSISNRDEKENLFLFFSTLYIFLSATLSEFEDTEREFLSSALRNAISIFNVTQAEKEKSSLDLDPKYGWP